MKMKTYTYADPTGGGEDIELKIPPWVNRPRDIALYDDTGHRHIFEWDGEDEDDD